MEVKDYLIVYGQNVPHRLPCYKESVIDCDDLIKYSDIIKAIIENKDKEANWIWGTDLVQNTDPNIPYAYLSKTRLFDMYPNLSKSDLLHFCDYLPSGITKIESIKIFSGQKVKVI